MSTLKSLEDDPRAGAEIVRGDDECSKETLNLLQELGFPKGILPLRDLEECGRNRETGFVWMKSKSPYEHFFREANTRVKYDKEVTAYVEKGKMKKMTGVKSKQLLLWVTIVELTIEEPERQKIYFKTAIGVGKSLPITCFMDEEEKKQFKEGK